MKTLNTPPNYLLNYVFLLFILCGVHNSLNGNNIIIIDNEGQKKTIEESNLTTLLNKYVIEEYPFFGLAFYYNNIRYYTIQESTVKELKPNDKVTLGKNEWFAAVGRFKVLAIKAKELSINIKGEKELSISAHTKAIDNFIVSKTQLSGIDPVLNQLRYAHLWFPIAVLTRFIEKVLVIIHDFTHFNWGVVIFLFAILFKLIMIPLTIITSRFQKEVSQTQSTLLPKLSEIKKNYDGEQAHNKIMSAHKELGVTPFYSLKPLIGPLVQIPFLIAIFNALGEMPQFVGESFLWISNLAYPDTITTFSSAIPLLGYKLSLLPFIMTGITIISTLLFKDPHAPADVLKSKKRNLYLMALIFFILFYPFPSSMVFYWTVANILYLIQQRIF